MTSNKQARKVQERTEFHFLVVAVRAGGMDSHLAAAAEVGDVSKVIQLLRGGADVNSQGGLNGETALIEAAYTGLYEEISPS